MTRERVARVAAVPSLARVRALLLLLAVPALLGLAASASGAGEAPAGPDARAAERTLRSEVVAARTGRPASAVSVRCRRGGERAFRCRFSVASAGRTTRWTGRGTLGFFDVRADSHRFRYTLRGTRKDCGAGGRRRCDVTRFSWWGTSGLVATRGSR